MRKDNVDLICDIAELASLYEKSRGLDDFLQASARLVADHMRTDVCSIYLFDPDRQQLILRANRGLSPDAVGAVRLALGEGITGVALKELRPICAERGSEHPHFKAFDGIHEEDYEAFMAVPISLGLERIGALVLQDRRPGYYGQADVKALRAIASQMGHVIENDRLLKDLHRADETIEAAPEGPRLVRGRAVSGGFAFGRAAWMEVPSPDRMLAEAEPGRSLRLEEFEEAFRRTEEQILSLQREMDERFGDVASLIFSAHHLIMNDAAFAGAIREAIERGVEPHRAVGDVVGRMVDLFSRSPNPRLREKEHDIKDLGRRLLHNLIQPDAPTHDYTNRIIVAPEILPSDVLRYAGEHAAGIILLSGGMTAHVSVLARSIGIPMVIPERARGFRIREGAELIMDAEQGTLFIDPSEDVKERYRDLAAARREALDARRMSDITRTADGIRIRLLANINLLSDVRTALDMKAEGIGLYRSEFPFIVRNEFPTEEEQYRIYRRLIEGMEGREVTLRTLDIGGDKMLSYYSHVRESNPFLGLRALRFSLRNRSIFVDQLRAMLRAAEGAPVRIMFPMVSSVDDFLEARGIVRECAQGLREEGLPFNDGVALGVMVELPSVIEVAEELASEADFLSIGTNDLIQYLLAVDRTNEQMSEFYQAYHPAVLRAMNRVARAAARHRKDLSICGDFASNEKFLAFLVGIGIRKISVDAHSLPRMQRAVEALNARRAARDAKAVLKLSRVAEIAKFLHVDGSETT
jgi:phosphotransferase system, enzyme I, PtsP